MEILTERLLIRPVRLGDSEALAARRSDPEVAKYQSWEAPYSTERASELVRAASEQSDPVSDEWHMLTIADPNDSEIFGDLALHPTWDGRSVEIGYTLAARYWGKGYAKEAVEALVERLFADERVTKLSAMTHPENYASALVVERCGFVFEGRTALSYWVGDENADDVHYGLTRDGYMEWLGREKNSPTTIELVEVTRDNWRALTGCATHKSEERFVSPVLPSLAVAVYAPVEYGEPLIPWTRAIEADGEVVGLVMMSEVTDAHPDPYLWRLIIDRRHQRRGIGGRVVQMVIDRVRSQGFASLRVSWVEGKGSPRPMYERIGFVPTGEFEDGETLARLEL